MIKFIIANFCYTPPIPRLDFFVHTVVCKVVTKRGDGNIALIDSGNIRALLAVDGFIRAH